MYRICVRDHVMIAHSLRGEVFGPARRLHGATFVVDAALARETLDADGVVADIGRLREALRTRLAPLDYRNLDEMDEFRGRNTTTEVLARWVFDGLAAALRAGALGEAAREACRLTVTLRESHLAWGSFEGDPRHAPPA